VLIYKMKKIEKMTKGNVAQRCYKISFHGGHIVEIFKNLDFDGGPEGVLDEAIGLFSRQHGKNQKSFKWDIIKVESEAATNIIIFHVECEEIFKQINEIHEKQREIIESSLMKAENVVEKPKKGNSKAKCPDCKELGNQIDDLKKILNESNATHANSTAALTKSNAALTEDFKKLHAQFLKHMKPMYSIYKRCLIYIMRDLIAKKIGRSPVDGMWYSFLEGISNSNSDLATLEMTQSIVLFIRDNARDGNKVAHGQDEIQIALAVTAVQEEGARSCWLHCFKMAFGSDATDWA